MPKHNNLTRTNILRMMRAKLSTRERNNKKNEKNSIFTGLSGNTKRMMLVKYGSKERKERNKTRRTTKATSAHRGGKRTRRR